MAVFLTIMAVIIVISITVFFVLSVYWLVVNFDREELSVIIDVLADVCKIFAGVVTGFILSVLFLISLLYLIEQFR